MPLQIAHDVLIADAAVAAIVGDKVHPKLAPQGESYPYVVVKVAATEPFNSLDGYADLSRNEVIVLAYAMEETVAGQLADACRAALQNAKHLCLGRAQDDVEFQTDASAFSVGFIHQIWTN